MNFFKSPKTIPYALFFVVALIFVSPVLFSDQTFYAFDILYGYAPWKELIGHKVVAANRLISDPIDGLYPGHYYLNYLYIQQQLQLNNHLPQWYDNNFAGFPFGYAYSYPLMFLLKYISIKTLHLSNIFVCLLLCGLGMYHYCRELKISNYVAMFAGIAWMLNGYSMVWLEFEIVLFTAASLPLILFCYEKIKRQPKFNLCNGLLMFFAIGLSFAGSYGHLLIYQYLFIACYILYDIIKTRQYFKFYLKNYCYIALTFLMSIITALPFIISHLKILEYAQRQEYPYSQLFQNTGKLYPSWLITWLLPDAFGSPALGGFQIPSLPTQSYNNYCELAIYCGITSLFFIIFCLFRLKRKNAFFYTITLILTLLMAAGSGLYYPLTKIVPSLAFSAPIRILYISNFCFVICAVLGLDNFSKRLKLFLYNTQKYQENLKKLLYIVIAWSVILTLIVLLTKSNLGYELRFGKNYVAAKSMLEAKSFYIYFKSIGLIVATLLIILLAIKKKISIKISIMLLTVVLSCDLYLFGHTFNTRSHKNMAYEKTPAIKYLINKQLKKNNSGNAFRIATYGNHLPNYLSAFNLQSLAGYSSFYSKDIGNYLYLINNQTAPVEGLSHPRWQMLDALNLKLNSLANIRYIIMPKQQPIIKHPSLPLIYNGEVKIYENKLSMNRIYFTTNSIGFEDKNELYNTLLKAPLKLLKTTAFFDGKAFSRLNKQIKKVKINVKKINSDFYKIQVNAPCDGGLIISNCYDKNWQYQLDNEPWKSVSKVNIFMQYIKIKKGNHKINLKYYDKNLTIALIINKIGWILFLIMLSFILFKNILAVNFLKTKSQKND